MPSADPESEDLSAQVVVADPRDQGPGREKDPPVDLLPGPARTAPPAAATADEAMRR